MKANMSPWTNPYKRYIRQVRQNKSDIKILEFFITGVTEALTL
jgi:hypothetical protein